MSGTLIDLLAGSVAAAPETTALVDGGPQPRRVTRDELWRRTVALHDDLRAHGVGAGDCVGVWLPNWSASVVAQFAAAALGAHVVGLNTRYGVAEVAHVLSRARPTVVLVAHGFLELDLAPTLAEAVTRSGVAAPSVGVLTGPGEPAATPEIATRYDAGAGAWVPRPSADGVRDTGAFHTTPDALAVAFTTSGSTGLPKLAAHLGSAVAAHARDVAAAGGWDDRSVSLVVLPLSGVFGYVPAYAALAAGGAALLEPVFDDDRVLEHMAEFGVTHLACADDVSGRIMARWRERPTRLGSWRRLLVADFYGRSPEVCAWAEDDVGAVALGVYGSSELFALLSFWHVDDPAGRRWRGGGHPVSSGTEVRVVDPDTGGPPADGEPGELQFRGRPVVDAYLGDADGSIRAASFTADGWFRSGDLGTAVAGGGFEYRCRMGDSLRLSGFLVEPAEIESRLAEHPSVGRTKVVGVQAGGRTRAVAFVEPAPGAEPDPVALRDWCAATLARFKVPESVQVIEEMPTTVGTNGAKIRAAALRELAAELVGGR